MKQSIKLFVVAAFVLLSVESQATSWRVCSRAEARANFTSCSAAVASLQVFAGDTLYVEPGHVESGNSFAISKQLTIIGPGYFLAENNINTMNSNDAVFTNNVNLAASAIKVSGCRFESIQITASSIEIERCYIRTLNITSENTGLIVRDCLIRDHINMSGQIGVYSALVENNIIEGYVEGSIVINRGTYYWRNSIFRNNTIFHNSTDFVMRQMNGCQIYNNIIINDNRGYTTTTTNQIVDTVWYRDRVFSDMIDCDIHHNILSCSTNASYQNCLFRKYWEDVLVGNGSSTGIEGRFMHIANGIAVGAGVGGSTVGAYGSVKGSTPYRPAGIPQYRPYIYDANIDQTPSSNNTINASFKIKVQND